LRTGYGYSLRRVEERARAEGGEIDNSQLSRYEKGICYPSFDKLRVLASVFNVSIQAFSDVVDLESFEKLKPASGDPVELLEEGIRVLQAGDNGHAFALFERSLELLLDEAPSVERRQLIGRARINQAAALRRLGRLSLAEQELRQALRNTDWLTPELHSRALLALANIHSDLGDLFLSEMEAEKAFVLAEANELDRMAAMALHTLGHGLSTQGRHADAVERFRQAVQLYGRCGEQYEAVRVRINIGACYVALGKTREGIRMLRETLMEARGGQHRRLEAFAWKCIGEAYFALDDYRRARSCFRESDARAVHNDEKQTDILFTNAYYEWQMATQENNPTREKIAFGRLKALRSSLERHLPEVEAFDEHVERGRHHA
jgi:tetratricopeptide (TPR) repeat protein